MTATELYDLLDKAGVDYEVVEIFDGSRWLKIDVEEQSFDAKESSEG